jgi:histidyl-tRNA synthetase
VPATGASIGVDRLADLLSRVEAGRRTSPVLVLALGSRQRVEQHRAAAELRAAGIPAEVYFGMQAKMKAQLAYADARGCAVAVMLGSEEVERGVVALKDLDMGKKLAAGITDRAEWRSGASAQVEVPRAGLVDAVRELLASRG